MPSQYGVEIGLLRNLVQGTELRPAILPHQITKVFLRAEHLALARQDGNNLIVVRQSAGKAFFDLSECLVKRSSAMERGTVFANVRNELLRFLTSFAGRDPPSIGADDATALYAHFDEWFGRLAMPRRIFVPCVISPWAAPHFSVGSAAFVFIDGVATSEFYPRAENSAARGEFDSLVTLMKDSGADWLACVSVEGCEHQRAEENGALAADLAIVALQLAAPLEWGTRTMGRLDTRRGPAERRTISEARGHYSAGWSRRKQPGLAIGTGTLAEMLRRAASIITAVGNRVTSFTTGQFRLSNLERAWCDAAYWLHDALAEPIDAIAVAKLETALEVLLCGESTWGSQVRMEAILATFYGLNPDDTLPGERHCS